MKVFVSGFSSFPGIAVNPTEIAVKQLSLRHQDIETHILDVTFEAVDNFVEAFDYRSYDLIVHCGVAVTSELFRLEFQGRNRVGDSPDAAAVVRPGEVLKNGSEVLKSSLNLERLAADMARLTPCEVSFDAGDYLCNYIYYRSLCRAEVNCAVLFVHVPDIVPQNICDFLSHLLDNLTAG